MTEPLDRYEWHGEVVRHVGASMTDAEYNALQSQHRAHDAEPTREERDHRRAANERSVMET